MKKVFALVVAMLMVLALSVSAFAATASTEFESVCEGNDPWVRLVKPGQTWEPSSEGWLDTEVITFDNWHFNITKLVEKAAGTDLANVSYVKVTLEMVGADSLVAYNEDGRAPKIDLEYGAIVNADATSAYGDTAPYQEADLAVIDSKNGDSSSNSITLEGEIPADAKVVTLNAGGFGVIAEPQKFVITVEVGGETASAVVDSEVAPEPVEEGEATSEPSEPSEPVAPAETGIVLAVLPMAVAAAALAISKKR